MCPPVENLESQLLYSDPCYIDEKTLRHVSIETVINYRRHLANVKVNTNWNPIESVLTWYFQLRKCIKYIQWIFGFIYIHQGKFEVSLTINKTLEIETNIRESLHGAEHFWGLYVNGKKNKFLRLCEQ